MSETFHVEKYRGCTIELHHDSDPESPREWCNFGTMACWHKRYNLGDEQPSISGGEYLMQLADAAVNFKCSVHDVQDKHISAALKKYYLILPLYLYDHSGITISTGPFYCPWDSGQVGVIHVSLKKAMEEFSSSNPTSWDSPVKFRDETITLEKAARQIMEQEVETYDDYLTGNVCGYVAKGYDGDDIGSCWGFYPDHTPHRQWDHAISQARKEVDAWIETMGDRDLSGEHDTAEVEV